MALLTSEVQRIKYELGYNVIGVGAEPMIGFVALFEQVIQPYISGGATTTSASPVTAATTPTLQSLVLSSATGFSAGDLVVIDVDVRQERATIQAITGSTISVLLSKAHSGTFPVTVEGGESIVREILQRLAQLTSGLNGQTGTLASLQSRVGIKKVDDVEFFGGGSTLASQGIDPMTQVLQLREIWRDELASALGVVRLNSKSNAGGSDIAVY